jgi:hypothetical protein
LRRKRAIQPFHVHLRAKNPVVGWLMRYLQLEGYVCSYESSFPSDVACRESVQMPSDAQNHAINALSRCDSVGMYASSPTCVKHLGGRL